MNEFNAPATKIHVYIILLLERVLFGAGLRGLIF